MTENWLAAVGLGLTIWDGEFKGKQFTWLRWCDRNSNLIPTGTERAKQERDRVEKAEQKASQLAEKLRALDVDPETIA